jgi:hypothetical protein
VLVVGAMHRAGLIYILFNGGFGHICVFFLFFFGGSAADLTGFQDAHLAVGHAVEVIGKVDGNLAIKVQAATDFGTNIGMCFLPHSCTAFVAAAVVGTC